MKIKNISIAIMILLIGIIIGITMERYCTQQIDYNTITDFVNIVILTLTLTVLIFYVWYTYKIAEVNSETYKIEHQPIINFDISSEIIPESGLLRTNVQVINHSIYPGALKMEVEFYLFNNNGMQKFTPKLPDAITPNDYYVGKILWPMGPKGSIKGTHFLIIPSLKPTINSEEELANYYKNNGKLWMRINSSCLDMQGKNISSWIRDWYLQLTYQQQPYNWMWVWEIDQKKLDKIKKNANLIIPNLPEKADQILTKLRSLNISWQEEINLQSAFHIIKTEQEGTAVKGHGGGWGLKETAEALGSSVGTISQGIRLTRAIQKYPDLKKHQNKTDAWNEYQKVYLPQELNDVPVL